MKDRECLWNTKSEHCIKKVIENALQEIVQEPNLLQFTTEDVRLKTKTIRTRYAAELAKVRNHKNWCRGTRHLCAEIVLVETSAFITTWRLYSPNFSVNKVSKHINLYFL
jgi:hypothetical protein